MSQKTSKTTVETVLWSSFGRYKVGMNVSHNGSVWINTTGKNSEPGVGSDFLEVDNTKLVIFKNIDELRSNIHFLEDGNIVKVLGYYNVDDGGGGDFYWDATSTETDNGGTIIESNNTATGRFKRVFDSELDVKDFGAVLNSNTDQSTPIQNAINFCGINNVKLLFSGSDSAKEYQINNTVTFNFQGLTVEFVGDVYLKPVDENLIDAVVIGGVGVPSRMMLKKLKVDRRAYNGTTENVGFKFLECVQSSFIDFESRYSKYNTLSAPTFSAFAYNLFENMQNIGGFYNIKLSATAPGYSNENKFIGGRCFSTPDLNTHVVLEEYETNHNTFLSMSTEGAGEQSWLVRGGSNVILYPRTEGSWVNGSIVLDTTSGGNTVKTTRYDGDVTDLNYPDGRNQIESYYNGTQIVTAINGESSLKAVRLGASGDNPASLVHDITSTTGNDYLNEWMHTRETEDSFVWKSLRQSGNILRSFLKTSGNLGVRAVEIFNSAWNFKPLVIGTYHFWINAGQLMTKASAPTSASDGIIIPEVAESVNIGFNNSANIINTSKKYKGKMVWDNSTQRPVFANGASATDVWRYSDGTIAYTPV